MQIKRHWISYSALGLFYAIAMNLLWIASTSLELIPNLVSWYLPAGLRITIFILAPIRSWPYLYVIERFTYFLLFKDGGLLDAPHFLTESLGWYLAHFLLQPTIFMFLVWQYRKRNEQSLLLTLNNAVALLLLFLTTSIVSGILFIGRKALESQEIANGLVANVLNHVLGDMAGIFLIFPIVILVKTLFENDSDTLTKQVTRSSLLWCALLSGYFVLNELIPEMDYYAKVLAFIPAIFLSLRYGVVGALSSVFYICVMTYMSALLNQGPTLESQFYMIAVSVCCFLMGAAVVEKATNEQHLKHKNADLNSANLELSKTLSHNRMLSSKLIAAQEEERKRLSMDLHDDFGQKLTAIKLSASMLKNNTASNSAYIDALVSTTDDLYVSLKNSIGGLSPSGLDDLGMIEVLKTGELANLVARKGLNYKFQAVGDDSSISNLQGINLYRIYQEAINNALKYADATRIDVKLIFTDSKLIMSIEDDGKGFDLAQVNKGFGLVSIEERAIALDATYAISSDRSGTAINMSVPLKN
jgi:glucose-6-phosphate-specific signal transduction histidine kinase